MRLMMVLIVAALFPSAGAREPDVSARRTEALERFAGILENTARTLKMPGRIALARTDAVLKDDPEVPMAIARLPEDDPLRKHGEFILFVRNQFLDDHPPGGLEHGAAHEVCHAVLGHLDTPEGVDEDREEFEAERCAYVTIGEDRYVSFMRAHAARSEKYRQFAEMDEREFRNWLRRAFGYEELPPEP